MKLLVAGSRSLTDQERICRSIDRHLPSPDITLLISGGAKGVDQIAEKWAKKKKIPVKQFIPHWKEFGKKAGILRNMEMVTEADFVLVFWDGISRGTKSTIQFAVQLHKPYFVVIMPREEPLMLGFHAEAIIVDDAPTSIKE